MIADLWIFLLYLRVEHIAGWNTSKGGENNNVELSMANNFIVTPDASIAPKQDGDVVCGL